MALENEVVTALIQLLSSLTSSDNGERAGAEEALNTKWISQRPDLLLAGLAEQIQIASDIALRSFAAVLLRRIASKETPVSESNDSETTVWDRSGVHTQVHVKSTLLDALAKEQDTGVRHKLSDLIAEISLISNGWPEVQQALVQCTVSAFAPHRESAFRIFNANSELWASANVEQIRKIFLAGLADGDKVVRLAAVQALCTYLVNATDDDRTGMASVIPALMNVLPPLLETADSESLTSALIAVNELVEVYPKIFKSLFSSMVNFCITVVRSKDLENAARQASLEVLVVFAEAAPGMCRKDPTYTNVVVVECLSLMTDLGDDSDVAEWLSTEDLELDDSDENHIVGEQALDRLARKLGGKTLLPSIFEWLPKLIASNKWQERHAALIALSSIAEGCEKIMCQELEKVLAMVLPNLAEVHPRVRWAACNAVGQMCTDFGGAVQEKFGQTVLNALTPVLDAPESRVAAHAAAAFVNFCENAEQATLEPFLDPILERLLNLLRRPQKYVQEQAVTTIATVADAAESRFIKYYSSIMPLLLGVLQNGNSEEYRLLRGKAMECATLIALAVGKETFAPQAQELISLLGAIQNGVTSPDDPQGSYLMASWGRICKVLGSDFYPYLEVVMPPILASAKLKPDFTVINDESEKESFDAEEGWEFFPLRGQQLGIKTSILEDKNSAVSILVLYAHELKAQFYPYVGEILREIALPGLLFYYHDGVRSASARLIPELLNCIKLASGEDQSALTNAWNNIVKKLLDLMKSEPSVEMLSEVYQAFYESVEVVGPQNLGQPLLEAFITSTESQITDYTRRTTAREADHRAGDVDLEQDDDVLYEIELDEELLSEMSKAIQVLFKQLKEGFIPSWKRLLPYLRNFSESQVPNCRQWTICIFDDLIEFCGEHAWEFRDSFIGPLARGLSDPSAEVRQAAAYGIGCAAQHGGDVFADLVAQSLPSLFAVTEQADAREIDNVYATENASVSIAKVCRFNSSKVGNLDEIISFWLKTMPVTHDEQDAPYAYRYLGELMDQKHQAVTSNPASVIDIIAQAIETAVLSGQNLSNLIASTKAFVSTSSSQAIEQIVAAMPSDRRAAFLKHFN